MRTLYRGSWTDAKARRATLRLFDEIEERLTELGYLWGDEDQYMVDIADEMTSSVRTLRDGLRLYWPERDAERQAAGGAA